MVDVDYDEEPSDWLVDWLVHQARLVGLERLPVPAHQRVIDLFEQRTNHRQLDGDTVAFDPLDFELAQLLFDSRQGLTLAGTRGAIDEIAGYELAYTSEAADVVIQVEMTSSTTSTIHGQILTRIATLLLGTRRPSRSPRRAQ